ARVARVVPADGHETCGLVHGDRGEVLGRAGDVAGGIIVDSDRGAPVRAVVVRVDNEDVGVVVGRGRDAAAVRVNHVDAAVMRAATVVVSQVGFGVDGAAAHVEWAGLRRDSGSSTDIRTVGRDGGIEPAGAQTVGIQVGAD